MCEMFIDLLYINTPARKQKINQTLILYSCAESFMLSNMGHEYKSTFIVERYKRTRRGFRGDFDLMQS